MSTLRPHRRDPREDIHRELATHVTERVDELVREGVSRLEAERRASIEFGDATAAERAMATTAHRMARVGTLRRTLGALAHDLRAALRVLRRQPGFANSRSGARAASAASPACAAIRR